MNGASFFFILASIFWTALRFFYFGVAFTIWYDDYLMGALSSRDHLPTKRVNVSTRSGAIYLVNINVTKLSLKAENGSFSFRKFTDAR